MLWIPSVAFVADAYGSVHDYVAAAVKTARVEDARVNAFLIVTGLVVRTLGIL